MRLLRLLFGAAILFTLVMALLPHPPRLPGEPDDKVQHIIAFTVLAIIGRFSYPAAPATILLIGLSGFGALIELLQMTPGLNRDGNLLDWFADTAAVGVVLLAARLLASARR